MKITTFNYIVYGVSAFLALILLLSGCSPAPCWCSDVELLDPCEEEGYLCSNYYATKENAQTRIGSHDFFLKGHTVPIVCGYKDGECGIWTCECECHSEGP